MLNFPTHAVRAQPQHRRPCFPTEKKTFLSIGTTEASFTTGFLLTPSIISTIADQIALPEPAVVSLTRPSLYYPGLSLSWTNQTRSPWYRFPSDANLHF